MKAYDIKINHRSFDRAQASDQGWCFGLPPGIEADHWPLDPDNGYPLMHAFTIKLPGDYRCHSSQLVAMSVFGTSFDMNKDGAPEIIDQVSAIFQTGSERPENRGLQEIWDREKRGHRNLFRMKDDLQVNYAVILLTSEEFDGPACRPPQSMPHQSQANLAPPCWLNTGTAAALFEAEWFGNFEERFGEVPEASLSYNRSLSLVERKDDPNAGVSVSRIDTLVDPTAKYQSPYFRNALGRRERHAWSENLCANHLGGTVEPVQNLPSLSPFYVEFEEELGGFNFGDGRCQLDVKAMKVSITRF